jgi:thiamine-phosphate pyrophosphorylase
MVSSGRLSILESRWGDAVQGFRTRALLAADAGIDLLQIREPGLEASRIAELAATAVDATRGSSTLVIVNDRLDVALTSGAAGVHLRGDSIPTEAARSLVTREFLVGRSVHGAREASARASAADYLIAGTIFPTQSKTTAWPLLGLEGLQAIVRAVRLPVLAIGGVSLERVAAVAAAGAAGIAAISLFTSASSVIETVRAVRQAFDTVKPAS